MLFFGGGGDGSLAIFLFFGYSIPVYREIYSRLSLRLILEVGACSRDQRRPFC